MTSEEPILWHINRAVARERERCAKVAEQYDNYTVDGRHSCVGAVIAMAIRGETEQRHD